MTDDPDLGVRAATIAPSSGILHGVGSAIHWVAGLMEPVRHLIMNLAIFAGVVLGGPAIYRQVTKSSFVIKDISVPPSIASRGLGGDVIAQQIFDHIAEINKQAGSKKDKADISGIDTTTTMPSINLPVGGLNLGAIISELRTLFGFVETKVTGEIYVASMGDPSKGTTNQYGLSLRVAGQGPLYHSEQPSHAIAPLVDAAAEQIMRRFDPINLGYYYYRKKYYQRASEVADEVMASGRADDIPWAFMMRGLIARQQGHHAEAATDLREAVARAPNFVVGYVTLASVLRQNGALDEAEAAARKVIALAPTQHDGYAALAAVLAERNQPDAALDEMHKALDAEPKSPVAYFKAGRLQMRLHRAEDAIASFKMSASMKPAAAPLLQAAKLLHDLHHDDEARQLLHDATQIEPKSPRAWFALGEAQLDLKANGRASRAFQKAAALDRESAETVLAEAKSLDAHKRYAEANQIFAHPAPKFVHEPAFLLGWSEHLWTEGHKPEAAAKVQEALASEALRPLEALRAGDLLQSRGEAAAAIDAYRRAMLLDPSLEKTLQPVVDRLAPSATSSVPTAAAMPPATPAVAPANAHAAATIAAVTPAVAHKAAAALPVGAITILARPKPAIHAHVAAPAVNPAPSLRTQAQTAPRPAAPAASTP